MHKDQSQAVTLTLILTICSLFYAVLEFHGPSSETQTYSNGSSIVAKKITTIIFTIKL